MTTFINNSGNIPDDPSSMTLPKVSPNRAPPWVIKHTSLEADLGELLGWLGYDDPDPRYFHIRGISLEDTRILEEKIYCVGYKPRFDWYSDSQIVVWRRRCPLLGCATDWLAGQRQVLENELRKVARCGQPDLTLFGAAEYPLEDATVAPDQQLHVDLIFKERNLERRFFFSNSRVVLETTYSQNIEYVEDKAWRYLHHSDGHCHVVIICDMTWPVTQPFKAVISVWTKQQTGIIDEDYPLELMDGVDHAPLDHPLPAEEQLVAGLASFESPVPSPTLAAKSPNPTRVELGLRTKGGLGGEREKKIVQRSVHVLIDETADQETEPEDQSESRELALLVYDFLRVCPIHQDAAPLDDDLVLPLKELRSRIRRALKLLRQGPS